MVPLHIEIDGDTSIPMHQAILQMQVIRPASIPVSEGEVENRVRNSEDQWKSRYDYQVHNWHWRISSHLSTNDGP